MSFLRRAEHPSNDALNAYLDGHAPASERARIEAHASGCGRCEDALHSLGTVRSALGGMPRAAAPRSFALREADVRPQSAVPARGLGWATPLLSGVAALAMLAFVVLVGIDAFGAASEGTGGGSSDAGAVLQDAEGAPAAADSDGSDSVQEVAPPNQDSASALDESQRCGPTAACRSAGGYLAYSNAYGPPSPRVFGPPRPAGLPATTGSAGADGGDDTALRTAEAATAAVALASVGAFAFLWWRGRARRWAG